MINFFFQHIEILGYFFTVLCNNRSASAEVAQRIAKRDMEVQ